MTSPASRRPPMPYDDEGDHEMGYGKPPRRSQFVKGQSGNPRGRPPGAKNLKTLLNKALNELVIVTENGGQRKISKREAIVTQLVNRSAQADLKAIQILLAMLRDIEGRAGLGMALDVAKHRQQDLDGFQIGLGRSIDELGDDRFALADLALPAILGDDDELVQRLVQQCLQVLGAGRPAARIAGPAFDEPAVAWWFAVTDLVIGLVASRHRRPPPR